MIGLSKKEGFPCVMLLSLTTCSCFMVYMGNHLFGDFYFISLKIHQLLGDLIARFEESIIASCSFKN